MKCFLKSYSVISLFYILLPFPVFAQELIPSTATNTDHRFKSCLFDAKWKCIDQERVPEKLGFHESILKNTYGNQLIPRKDLKECGEKGSILERVKDCSLKNPQWASYDGPKAGNENEAIWNLVTVIKNKNQELFEVWQDQKTNKLWSDKTQHSYNWYRAVGYAKPKDISILESQFAAEPGHKDTSAPFKINVILQPKNPISVCTSPKELSLKNEFHYTYEAPMEKLDFKGNLSEENVSWSVPSRDDWMMAEVNGIRKVLPNMDYKFWTSTTGSDYRNSSWIFAGDYGTFDGSDKHISNYVRCVGKVK